MVYGIFNVVAGRKEVGSEIELAANRKEYYDDETLEGSASSGFNCSACSCSSSVVIGLPVVWILEPGRQEGAALGWNNRYASGVAAVCSDCRGRLQLRRVSRWHGAVGGEAPFTVTDQLTGEVTAVNWKAPALNTILLPV